MIVTDRLDLRPFTVATAAATADAARGDLPWADGFPRDDDRDAARMYVRAPHEVFGSWFIAERVTGEIVGTIGFFGPPDPDGEVMMGYGLVAQARGRGYATEALRALAEYGLALPGVTRIVADPDLDNVASHRVLEKSGFHRTHATETSQWYARTSRP
jgi:ribosomal-protein-alanine N-acetyltransferase